MKRIEVLSIAMLAVFAVGAIAASAAQAGEFHSEIEKTFLFGEQEGEIVFTTTAGKAKCKVATLDSLNAVVGAEVEAKDFKTNTIIGQLQLVNCAAFGQAATYDNPPSQTGSACDIHATATATGANVKLSGTPVPANPSTASCETKITVPSGNCSVVINNQTPSNPAETFANVMFGGKGAIKGTYSLSGLVYTVEGSPGSVCGEPGTNVNGTLSGSMVVRGYSSSTHTSANQVGISYR